MEKKSITKTNKLKPKPTNVCDAVRGESKAMDIKKQKIKKTKSKKKNLRG